MNATSTVVRRWVNVYTRGLKTDVRDARRAEIESDLWSHAEDAYERGHGPWLLELEMTTRLVLGMPADIAWRHSQRGNVHRDRRDVMITEPRANQALTGIGLAVAFLYAFFAVWAMWNSTADERVAGLAIFVTFTGGAVLALIGLLAVGRSPNVGGGLAIPGGALVGAAFLYASWMWPVGVVASLPLVVIAVVRRQQVLNARARANGGAAEPSPAGS